MRHPRADETATVALIRETPSIESLNGTFRRECLDRWLFADDREAQLVTEQWRQEYINRRPHSSLGYLPPAVFVDQARLTLDLVQLLGAGHPPLPQLGPKRWLTLREQDLRSATDFVECPMTDNFTPCA